MFLGIGFIICTILAVIIGVKVGRNRRAKGKGAFFSGITGIFGGAVAGFFLLVALALIDISVNGSDRKIEEIETVASEEQPAHADNESIQTTPGASAASDAPATSVAPTTASDGIEHFDDVISMAEHLNDYPPETGDFSVIESSPLHIQLLPSTFKGEPGEVMHDTNWRAALYGVYNTFIHTDAEHVTVDAIPRQYASMVNRKDPKLLTSQQITLDMSREEALEVVQGLIDVSSLQDLKAKHPKWDFYGWTDDWNSIYYSDQQPGLGAFIQALQPYCSHSCR